MSVPMPSLHMWLRLCVMTVSFCAIPLNVWAIVQKIDDCIVSWNPITTDIYNLPTSVQGYKVYVRQYGGGTLQWGLPINVSPSTAPQTTCKALGLNQTGVYALSVTAYNAAFESPFSDIVEVALTVSPLYLEVAGAPKLPLHGTTTPVTVRITGETPTTVQLSRDGAPPFATWPSDTFFTWSPDGRSLTGNWCITSSCWSEVAGRHVLYAVATYVNGATVTVAVMLNVADSVSSSP